MKFEEALSALREGAKIWHRGMPDDEYYMGCKVGEALPSNLPLSIVWMKSGKQHPDMMPQWNPYDPKTYPCKHGIMPMINLSWLMSEGWKILGGIK